MSLPALRFKEFNGEWVAKKLSDVASRIGDGLHSTPVYDESGDYYFVNGNNLTNNKIEINESTKRLNNSEYLKHKVELSSKSILMSINGTIGNLAFFNNEPVVLGKSACYINLKADENKHFVFNLLQTSNIKSYFDKELTGSTIKNLSLTTIKNTSAYFPCHEEQTKIANFLTAVDEKITQLTQKHDLLTQYKKGVMQQIFSQELRFKDDDGGDFPEWVEHKIGELFYRSAHASKTEHITNDGKYIIVDMGSISREAKLLGTKRTNYTQDFLSTNDLIMAKDDIGGGNIIGRVVLIPENNKYICGDHVYKLTIKRGYIQYFYYAINSYKVNRSFRQKANGTAQIGISNKTVDEQLVPTPCIKEQIKIANILSAIDDKITATQTQLQAVKQYKQGLLQQMFV